MNLIEPLLIIAKTTAAVTLVALAVGQVYRPWISAPRRGVLRRFRLPLRARLRLHSLWLLGTAMLVGLALSPQVEIGPIPLGILAAGMIVLAAIPVHYTITAEGIRVGRTPMRRWTQFAGLSARGGWIFLQPVAGSRGLLVRSPGGADGEALVAEIRGLVRRSYQGELAPSSTAEAVTASLDGAPEGSVA